MTVDTAPGRIRLGFLSACLPSLSLDEVVDTAAIEGFACVEVAVWPDEPGRDWEASHIDVRQFDVAEAKRVLELFQGRGVDISALAYYENNLHADEHRRRLIHDHLRAVIDAAELLGVDLVGTFVGRDVTRTVDQNIELAESVLPPLVGYADDRGVRLVVENCPMEGWHPDGYPANLAYSPELWDWMAGLGLYLNFDPSHLVWLGIDPVTVLGEYADRVLHVQAKDVEIDAAGRNHVGVFGRTRDRGADAWRSGWWRYRLPGLGEVDWARLVDTLYQTGYSGVVSVEHEDPVWSGTPELVRRGLGVAHRTLSPLLVS